MRDNLGAVRMRVGRNVKQLRLLRGLSQEKLAELVGNTQKHLSQVERGRVNVSIDILTAIAARLSVDVSELFDITSNDSTATPLYRITRRELGQIEHALRTIERVKLTAARHGR